MNIFLIEYSHEGRVLNLGSVAYKVQADADKAVQRTAEDDADAFALSMRVIEYAPAEDFNRLADRATAMVGGLELQIMDLQKQLGAANRALDTIRKGHMSNSIN
jgi:hypothetical protein